MAIYGEALVAGVIAQRAQADRHPEQRVPDQGRARPAYSRLDTSRVRSATSACTLPDWRVGLREVIGEIAEAKNA